MKMLELETLRRLGDDFCFLGEEVGYGELGVRFRSFPYKDMRDFEENAPSGDCFESDGVVFYKVKDSEDQHFVIYIEGGEVKKY